MKKRTFITVIIMMILVSITTSATMSVKYYKKMIKKQKIGKVREYWSEDLTAKILENRGDDIIIEKIIGTVIDKKKNGKVMNSTNKDDDISYKRVKGAKRGDVILTICIYTPNNKYVDDICLRFDYIIDRTR